MKGLFFSNSSLATKVCCFSGLLACLLLTSPLIITGHAQTITYLVSSTPAELNSLGKSEILGEVLISKVSVGGAPQLTQASTISFVYPGIAIQDTFSGLRTVDLATGIIGDPGGITVTLTGGFINAGASAQVTNQVAV